MSWVKDTCLRDELEVVEQRIATALKSREKVLNQAGQMLLSSGGKRLRPTLVLLGSRFGNLSRDLAIDMAAAIEILHMATLVHDDIIDQANLRRGQPTVQARYGPDIAVLTGDFLLTKALQLVAQADLQDQALQLSRAMLAICEGEVAQFSDRFRTNVSILRYLRRIRGKTAALFAVSASCAARQGGAPEAQVAALRHYGLNLGMAFQIYDDMLDYVACETTIGKPVAADAQSGVYTLPVLLARRNTSIAQRLENLLESPAEGTNAAELSKLVVAGGGLTGSQNLARRYTARAKRQLSRLPEGEARAILHDLPDVLFQRAEASQQPASLTAEPLYNNLIAINEATH